MTSYDVAAAIYYIVPLVLCPLVAIWFCVLGWFIRAGFAILVISMIPVICEASLYKDTDVSGAGILPILVAPISLLFIGIGIVRFTVHAGKQLYRRWRARRAEAA